MKGSSPHLAWARHSSGSFYSSGCSSNFSHQAHPLLANEQQCPPGSGCLSFLLLTPYSHPLQLYPCLSLDGRLYFSAPKCISPAHFFLYLQLFTRTSERHRGLYVSKAEFTILPPPRPPLQSWSALGAHISVRGTANCPAVQLRNPRGLGHLSPSASMARLPPVSLHLISSVALDSVVFHIFTVPS